MDNQQSMKEKLRIAITLGVSKGICTEQIGMNTGYWCHLPDGTRKRIAGATKLIQYLESYK